jgi:pyruvate/2-oxoglutarate dehydrogenase complex dihydrolipoamide acyltransferase (E2) component
LAVPINSIESVEKRFTSRCPHGRRLVAPVAEATGVKPTLLPFPATAAMEALRLNPVINASIDPEGRTITYELLAER